MLRDVLHTSGGLLHGLLQAPQRAVVCSTHWPLQ